MMQVMQKMETNGSTPKTAGPSKPSWRKPTIVETACGLEINCYATPKG